MTAVITLSHRDYDAVLFDLDGAASITLGIVDKINEFVSDTTRTFPLLSGHPRNSQGEQAGREVR